MSEQHRTKSLSEFKELENIENDQYLIGIDDIDIGNGARIKFDNFINSCISSDENNKIILGTDNKLYNLSAINLYLEDMVYKSGDWVLGDVNDERNMYESLQDDNIGNALTDTSYWKKIDFDISEIEEIEAQLATKEDIDTWVYYENGASGYRYNKRNGYCEQWCSYIYNKQQNVPDNVNLLKTYKDTNYCLTYGVDFEVSVSGAGVYCKRISPSQICLANRGTAYFSHVSWKTSGFLAEGEY